MFSRRMLLARSPLIAAAPFAPTFLMRTVLMPTIAAAPPLRQDDRVLIVIQLDGGNDGLNTVVPYADEHYAKFRKKLKLPAASLVKINDEAALHPSMRAAGELLNDGRLAIVQGVGYPNPSRSHFLSMAIWQSARFDQQQHDLGWLGRALDGAKRRQYADSYFIGTKPLPGALRGRRSVAGSLQPGESFALKSPIKPQKVLEAPKKVADLRSFVRRSVLDAYATADELAEAAKKDDRSAVYPSTPLSTRLRLIGQLIKSRMSARVYYAIQPGYDTHADQLPTHSRLLAEFSGAVKAFLDDMTAAGLADRILLMAFSEFGRRVAENGSSGTDHGTAGPVFLAGSSVKPGLFGPTPKLHDLKDGDLKSSCDFRQIYATLLEDWFGVASRKALGEKFDKLPLLQG